MDKVDEVVRLFNAVSASHAQKFRVDSKQIRHAVWQMGQAYRPNPFWEREDISNTTRYDTAGHQCAYLQKYAMIHTGLVYEVLQQALRIHTAESSIANKKIFRLCSLGSGPGTDIVAFMFVLEETFGLKRCQASLVDQSGKWKSVFDLIVRELKTKNYSISDMVSGDNFSYEYLEADLLDFCDVTVFDAISNADVITMIKFISAAACNKTRSMVQDIFRVMKPGAMILFIDNASGGFYEMLQESAESYGLESVIGPWKHYDYEEERFKLEQHGHISQYKAKVTIEMWKKPITLSQNTTNQLRNEFLSRRPTAKVQGLEWEAQGGDSIVNQSATSGNNEYSDEVDHIRPQSIRLQADHTDTKERENGCCSIM